MRSPAVVGTLAVTFLVMTASNSMYTYLAVLVDGAAGQVGFGLFVATFGLAGVVGTWWGGTAADRHGSRGVLMLAVGTLMVGFVALPFLTTTVAAALTVVVGWGIAVWGFVPVQQHHLIELGSRAMSGRIDTAVEHSGDPARNGPSAPLLLALNSSTTHLGFAAGALLGGLVVDSAGAGSLWQLAVACCGAGLMVQMVLTRKVGS
jgi:predicted MFS family arabinose efflux permease